MRTERISIKKIKQVVQQIADNLNPSKIILFGSYASGKPTRDSDVDLLIVMSTKKRPAERVVEVTKTLAPYPFPMDIMVRTPTEIKSRERVGDGFYEEILKTGKVLYERKAG